MDIQKIISVIDDSVQNITRKNIYISKMSIIPSFVDKPLTSSFTEYVFGLAAYKHNFYFPSGTATIIAPNLLMTAKHVVEDFYLRFDKSRIATPEIGRSINLNATFNIVAIQILERGKKGALWEVRKIYLSSTTDIAFLLISPASKEALAYEWKIPVIDFSPPKEGTRVDCFGFRESRVKLKESELEWFDIPTHATGIVKEIHHEYRDKSRINFPCFQTNARFDGGMSGGPVIDESGALIGVISSNLPPEDETGEHISYVALIWPSLLTPIDITVEGLIINIPYPIYDLAKYGILNSRNIEQVRIESSTRISLQSEI